MKKNVTKKSIFHTKNAVRIEDEVGKTVELMELDGAFVGVSPFKRGSVICVSPVHQRFHCLLSEHRGDVITYRKMIDRSSFIKTVEQLARESGVQLEYEDQGTGTKQTGFAFDQKKAS